MILVADAGPLMALAKIGALEVLTSLPGEILTPSSVHQEAVTAGLTLGADDALVLRDEYERGRLEIRTPSALHIDTEVVLGTGVRIPAWTDLGA